MKKKSIIIVVAVVLLCGIFLVRADDTYSPFYELGEKLDAVYEAVVSEGSDVAQREGYCQYFETPAHDSQVVFTVPAEKRFVLLKLHRNGPCDFDWNLTVDDTLFIKGKQENPILFQE